MKAVTYHQYGGPEVLKIGEIEKPRLEPNKVLIQVRASSINAADWRLMRADPFLIRLMSGILRPKKWNILGSDFAGVVSEVGSEVSDIEVGDEVYGDSFGDGRGSHAEFLCIQRHFLDAKPEQLNFEEAASIPLVGITALQGLRDLAKISTDQEVLIQGAGGGVGISAVQIAKSLGAKVTAVCGPKSVALVRKLGADRVLNYEESDYTSEEVLYDAIIGINGYNTLSTYKRLLKPEGRFVLIGGKNRGFFEAMFLGSLVFLGSKKSIKTLSIDDARIQGDLVQLREMVESKTLVPIIDRSFPLAETPDAIRYAEKGHVLGKITIRVSPD
ncbi:MAG: NADPH:quinone reductase-like Zn-dependent oxidoreductase [Planctomycetota bacterium]|jgi:NADPH:quinone reductase-like Zn-dependent oxidoreductase